MVMNQRDEQERRPKVHETVAHELRRRIVRGELEPGDRLPPEEELTGSFGIARTTLREALRVLESEGLIAIRRGRGGGPVVTRPDIDHLAQALAVTLQLEATTLGDLDEARQLLESQVAAHLAMHHESLDLSVLDEAIDQADTAAAAADTIAFGAAAARVHEAMVASSANTTMMTISRLLRALVEGYYGEAASRASADEMARAVRSYRKLRTMIDRGDVEAARAHWRAHMSYTIRRSGPDAPLDLYRE